MIEVVMQKAHHANHERALAARIEKPYSGALENNVTVDLTQRPLRGFRVRLGNYVVAARMLDKKRTTLVGKNGDYIYKSTTDQRAAQFLGFGSDTLSTNGQAAGVTGNARMGPGLCQQWENITPSSSSANLMSISALEEQRNLTFSNIEEQTYE